MTTFSITTSQTTVGQPGVRASFVNTGSTPVTLAWSGRAEVLYPGGGTDPRSTLTLTPLSRVTGSTGAGTSTLAVTTVPTVAAANTTDVAPTSALRTFHARLANRATSPCDIIALGDSITGGEGATLMTNRWTDVLRDQLRTAYPVAGVAGGYGLILPGGYLASTWTTPFSSYVTLAGGAARGGGNYGFFGTVQLGSAGQTVTLQAIGATDIDVFYGISSSFVSSFTVTVDGGSASAPVTTGGGPASLSPTAYHITGLSAGTHTVTVTYAGPYNAYILGFGVYQGDAGKGARMWNGAQGGWLSSQFAAVAAKWEDFAEFVNPALAVITIGANDYKTGVPVAAYRANLDAIIGRLRAKTTASILMVVQHALGGVTIVNPWADYVDAQYDAAAAAGDVTVLNMFNRLGPQPNTDVPGMLSVSDGGQHPVDAGYTFMADSILRAITRF